MGSPPHKDPNPLRDRCVLYEGYFGFSVQCAVGRSIEELASFCPNNKVGVTTVGAIRDLGYDVVVTPGKGAHATVAVPPDWTWDDSVKLIALFREETNPSPRGAR